MSFLRQLADFFGFSDARKTPEQSSFTPEDLGGWAAAQQRRSFPTLLEASRAALPPPGLSMEAACDLSVNAYALQVAVIASTFHEVLDDSRYLSGANKGGADIVAFLTRIQSKARDVSTPYAKVGTSQFDPFPIMGCIMDIKDLLPKILLYYTSMVTGLEPLARAEPEAVSFATLQLRLMGTTNPLASAVALAYFFAFRDVLTKDPAVVPLTFGLWGRYFLAFQERLFAFASGRKSEFR